MTDVVSQAAETVAKVEAAAAPAVAVVSADVAKAATELSFVRANWGKLSAIVVAAAVVGAIVGHVL